jgi:hypothetical protein
LPLFFIPGFSDSKLSGVQFVELVLAACLVMPSLIILHELGYLLVAKMLLEVTPDREALR